MWITLLTPKEEKNKIKANQSSNVSFYYISCCEREPSDDMNISISFLSTEEKEKVDRDLDFFLKENKIDTHI